MTPAGIEPATFRFVAQRLNHCATAVPLSTFNKTSESMNGLHEMWLLSQIKAQICYALAGFGPDASSQPPFCTALQTEFNFHQSPRRAFLSSCSKIFYLPRLLPLVQNSQFIAYVCPKYRPVKIHSWASFWWSFANQFKNKIACSQSNTTTILHVTIHGFLLIFVMDVQ